MAQVSKSQASLRIGGDELDPQEITVLLGSEPSSSYSKGEELVGKKTGRVRIAPFGFWCKNAKKREPEDLDGQIDEILSQLNDDLGVWADVSKRFDVNLFVGLFLDEGNEGCVLSADSIAKLGNRAIELQLDIYDGRE